MFVHDLPTPALIIDADVLEANLSTMAAARPGTALRPHVKAHKCTSLARRQSAHGHHGFTCATPREALGMAAAGLGADLLIANEVLDLRRLRALAELPADVRVTVAIDSDATLDAAATAGLHRCVIDVDVGLPRCGCSPDDAGRLAELARARGLEVRGVMGYEGHLMMVADRARQRDKVEAAMAMLRRAHDDVGGDVISAGGTGTYDLHDRTGATEVQAGSYALMDSAYASLGLPFQQAVFVVGTVIATKPGYAVADVGLKALGMDHGNPSVDGADVWFCSDEHLTFSDAAGEAPGGAAVPNHNTTSQRPHRHPEATGEAPGGAAAPNHNTTSQRPHRHPEATGEAPGGAAAPNHDTTPQARGWRVGDRVRVVPAHVDPTMALHETAWLVRGEEVLERWPIDLRGWG